MGHTPSGAREPIRDIRGEPSAAGRGRGVGLGRGQGPVGIGRGQGPVGRGQQRVQFNDNPAPEAPPAFVPGPHIVGAPRPESIPRPSFEPEMPSMDEIQADPQAAELLQQAMAALQRNKEQQSKGVVVVSTILHR